MTVTLEQARQAKHQLDTLQRLADMLPELEKQEKQSALKAHADSEMAAARQAVRDVMSNVQEHKQQLGINFRQWADQGAQLAGEHAALVSMLLSLKETVTRAAHAVARASVTYRGREDDAALRMAVARAMGDIVQGVNLDAEILHLWGDVQPGGFVDQLKGELDKRSRAQNSSW